MNDLSADCMPRTIVSKASFARMMNRSGACVSHWIRTGRLSPESLVGVGRNARIWKERAEADLAANLNAVQQSLQQHPLRGLDDHDVPRKDMSLHAELALIDENLCRNDLSPAERSAAQARRKAIYIELHPETVHGATGRGRPKNRVADSATLSGTNDQAERYTKEAAKVTGQSERAVRQDVHRGEVLGEDALAKLATTLHPASMKPPPTKLHRNTQSHHVGCQEDKQHGQ